MCVGGVGVRGSVYVYMCLRERESVFVRVYSRVSVYVRMCSHVSVSVPVCSRVSVCTNSVPFHRHDFVKCFSCFTKPVHQFCIISQVFQRFTAITLSISLIFRAYMP